jgi:tRNA(Arg) A34 adenosine deaminase TadA
MQHEAFIRECLALAIKSGKKGNYTFGAVLVHEGKIIESAENTEVTGSSYGHAEYNLVVKAIERHPDDVLSNSTLYTSTTPCPRCTFAILAANVPRIVYSVSHAAFGRLFPGELKNMPCEEIIERTERQVETVGPILEDEGLRVFEHWAGEYTPLEEILERARRAKR